MVVEKILNKEYNEAGLAVVLEVVCGFLRASKIFDDSSIIESSKQCCYEIIFRIMRISTIKFLDNRSAALSFFLIERDPKRWQNFWRKFLTELLSDLSCIGTKRIEYFHYASCILRSWLWRAKAISESYMNWYINNPILDTERACFIASDNLCLIFYIMFDYQKFDSLSNSS